MLSAKAYLKKYTLISPAFIDELYLMYTEENTNQDLVINLDAVSKWLGTPKNALHQLLKDRKCKHGEDYVARKTAPPTKSDPRANHYTEIHSVP